MSDTWGTVYSMERDKATGNDPDSLRAEIRRLRQDRGDCQMVMDGQQARIEVLLAALESIAKAHVPDQPCTDPSSELHWCQRHVATLRKIAMDALNQQQAREK